MNDQHYTPESAEPVAAVSELQTAEQPNPAPEESPVKAWAAKPLTPEQQRRLLRKTRRTSVVWWGAALGSVACMLGSALDLCETAQELFETLGTTLIVVALIAGWMVLMKLLHGERRVPPGPFGEPRVNELHPEGAVSRGAFGTVVIPFEDITYYGETAGLLILRGRGGVIVWSAEDLTPTEAADIQVCLRGKAPAGTMQIQAAFEGRKPEPIPGSVSAPLPAFPKRGACHATATAESRPLRVATLRLAQILERGVPPMWLLAIGIGGLLCRLFAFTTDLLNSPLVWFALLAIGQALLLFLYLWVEAAVQKARQKTTPRFSFCEDGMWMSVGHGERRFPRGSVSAIRTRKSVDLLLPNGLVRLPYALMDSKDLVLRYFDLPG